VGVRSERAKRASCENKNFEHPQGQPYGIFELHASRRTVCVEAKRAFIVLTSNSLLQQQRRPRSESVPLFNNTFVNRLDAHNYDLIHKVRKPAERGAKRRAVRTPVEVTTRHFRTPRRGHHVDLRTFVGAFWRCVDFCAPYKIARNDAETASHGVVLCTWGRDECGCRRVLDRREQRTLVPRNGRLKFVARLALRSERGWGCEARCY